MSVQTQADARLEDLLFMYDMGEYVPRIAERLGMKESSVKQTLRRNGRDPNRMEKARIPNYQEMRHLGGSRWLIEGYQVEQQSSRRWALTKKDRTTVSFSTLTEAQEWIATQ